MRKLLVMAAVVLLVPVALQAQTAEACGVCHSSILSQWKESTHAGSWKSPRFLAQVEAVGKPDFCASCHAPLSVWQEVNLKPAPATPAAEGLEPLPPTAPEFEALLALIPIPRKDQFEDGVNCAACHSVPVVTPTGRGEEFVGPYHAVEGHGGTAVDAFSDARLCSSCHGGDPAHFTPEGATLPADYYHRDAVPVKFETGSSDCSGCHMPKRTARLVQLRTFRHLATREVGHHGFGNSRWEGLADAVAFEVTGSALRITNRTVGHPLQINPHHEYQLEIVASRGGRELGKHQARILGPGKLGMGESMEVELPFAVQAGDAVTVRLSLAKPDLPAQVVFEKKL